MYRRNGKALIVFVLAISGAAVAQNAMHAVAGAVTKVDDAGKTIAVKTADGTEHVFKYTAKTSVTGAQAAGEDVKTAGVDSYMKGKEGTHVVVRYMGKGSDKTAVSIKDFGKDALKTGRGTITHVDHAAHTVAIKTEQGGEDTYRVSKDATIDTEHGIVEGSKYTAKEGDKVLFHYSEEGGDKIVHFVKHI
jgi:YD repeat-containing protein